MPGTYFEKLFDLELDYNNIIANPKGVYVDSVDILLNHVLNSTNISEIRTKMWAFALTREDVFDEELININKAIEESNGKMDQYVLYTDLINKEILGTFTYYENLLRTGYGIFQYGMHDPDKFEFKYLATVGPRTRYSLYITEKDVEVAHNSDGSDPINDSLGIK